MASDLYKETEQLTQAINDYYDGKDAFPEFPIAKTEAYDKLTALPNVNAMEMADGSVGDYVYTSVQSGANSENIGDIEDSNTQISASDSYNIQIPSTADDYTGDTMAIKSAIGLGEAAGGLVKYHGGTMKTISFAVASVLVANLVGKIIGKSVYTDDPAIFSYEQIKKTLGDSWNDGYATKDGKAPIYYLVDKFGNLKSYIQKDLIPALTFYEGAKKNLFSYAIKIPQNPEQGNIVLDKCVTDDFLGLFNYCSKKCKNVITNISDDDGALNNFIATYCTNDYVIGALTIRSNIYVASSSVLSISVVKYNDIIAKELPFEKASNRDVLIYEGGKNIYGTFADFRGYVDRDDKTTLHILSLSEIHHQEMYHQLYYGEGVDQPDYEGDNSWYSVSNLGSTLGKQPGIDDQPDSNVITQADIGDTVNDTLNNLVQKYPDTFSDDNTITKHVVQKDGTIKDIKLVQVPYPVYTGTEDEPVTDGVTDYVSQTTPDPPASTLPDDLLKLINDGLGNRGTSTITPSTGGGTTPSVTTPSQAATALWTIYNPTKEQLDAFGAYLWSTNFLENVKKLMSDPMQAVIGLKSVFMRPKRGESATIKVGFSDSGVSSVKVPDQYNNLNCGSVDVPEYFGNVLDYAPYTKISLYLPFIGIVQLNPADVLRSTITVEYKGDVLTGACIAEIAVKRDNAGGILYQYSGNMACDYPLTSGNYTAVISAGLNAAGSAIGGALVGGVPGALLGGGRSALSSLANGNLFNVQQSGGFSGASGVLGGKKPYLIISRPQPEINEHFPELQGYGSNKYVTLSECTGYTRVKAVHVDKIEKATSAEKDMIETALKNGVIFK